MRFDEAMRTGNPNCRQPVKLRPFGFFYQIIACLSVTKSCIDILHVSKISSSRAARHIASSVDVEQA